MCHGGLETTPLFSGTGMLQVGVSWWDSYLTSQDVDLARGSRQLFRTLPDFHLRRDDLGKSPHLARLLDRVQDDPRPRWGALPTARIGNSVFPDHCGDDDPKCMKFGAQLRFADFALRFGSEFGTPDMA